MVKFLKISMQLSAIVFIALIAGCSSSEKPYCPPGMSINPTSGFTQASPKISGVGPTLPSTSYSNCGPCNITPDLHIISLNNTITIILPSDRLFETASANFKPAAQHTLSQVIDVLKEYPHQNIHVSANTDPISAHTRQHNVLLSVQQAKNVGGYLWSHAIQQGNTCRTLTYNGQGDEDPIATNSKLAGMRHNRRVEIMIYPQRGKYCNQDTCCVLHKITSAPQLHRSWYYSKKTLVEYGTIIFIALS